MWPPLFVKVDKYDLPEAVDEPVWKSLDNREELTGVEREKMIKSSKTMLRSFPSFRSFITKQQTWVFPLVEHRLILMTLYQRKSDYGVSVFGSNRSLQNRSGNFQTLE